MIDRLYRRHVLRPLYYALAWMLFHIYGAEEGQRRFYEMTGAPRG